MSDPHESLTPGLNSPTMRAAEITPDDVTDISTTGTWVYVGTGGNVRVTTAGGDVVTYTNAQDGSVLPVRVRRIWATGTTATGLIQNW